MKQPSFVLASVLLSVLKSALGGDSCSQGDYFNFLDCIGGKIRKEWSLLEDKQDAKINEDRQKFFDCYDQASCNSGLSFDVDFVNLLDPEIRKLATLIRDFWDSAPMGMQRCILSDIEKKFFGEIEGCVQQRVPEFAIPDPLPELPMPSQNMFHNHRDLLIRYIQDRIIALLSDADCSSGQRSQIVECIKQSTNSDEDLRNCVQDSLCSSSSCRANFQPVCSATSECIKQTIDSTGKKLTSLEDESKSTVLKFLGTCEDEANAVAGEPRYRFNRVTILNIAKEITGLGDRLNSKFKSLLKDLIDAYFNGDAFCASACQ